MKRSSFVPLEALSRRMSPDCRSSDERTGHLLLTGFFDRGNLGDDLMVHQIDALLRESGRAASQCRLPRGLKEALRFVRAARRSSRVLLVGGTHFDRADGLRCYAAQAKHLVLAYVLKACGVPFDYVGVGFAIPDRLVAHALLHLHLLTVGDVTVRDGKSAERMQQLGRDVEIVGDTALAVPLIAPTGLHRDVLLVAPAARRSAPTTVSAVDVLETASRRALGRIRVLAAYCPERGTGDRSVAEALVVDLDRLALAGLSTPKVELVTYGGDPLDPDIWGGVGAVVSERFHVSLVGVVTATPTTVIPNTEKQHWLAQEPVHTESVQAAWRRWAASLPVPVVQ